MRILGIESSCDETAVSIVEDGTKILSNVIASQTELHAQFGGVFPEVASRKHIEVVHAVVEQSLNDAAMGWSDIDALAVTHGPGLVGSLLVGVNMAKGLALGTGLPLIGVNHIEGHIYSLWLTEHAPEIQFPILNLIVSGGHTELYLMHDHGKYERLGGTLDDAAGEAYDKVGRLLKLPFPGGPYIDKAAQNGDAKAFDLPRAVMKDGYNFSFSGLKTAVLRLTQKYDDASRLPVDDISASFQAAVVDALVTKTVAAAKAHNVTAIHIAGGVSANSGLRKGMSVAVDIPVRYPPLVLCTDNAAMIASAAFFSQDRSPRGLDLDVQPSLRLAI